MFTLSLVLACNQMDKLGRLFIFLLLKWSPAPEAAQGWGPVVLDQQDARLTSVSHTL